MPELIGQTFARPDCMLRELWNHEIQECKSAVVFCSNASDKLSISGAESRCSWQSESEVVGEPLKPLAILHSESEDKESVKMFFNLEQSLC